MMEMITGIEQLAFFSLNYSLIQFFVVIFQLLTRVNFKMSNIDTKTAYFN